MRRTFAGMAVAASLALFASGSAHAQQAANLAAAEDHFRQGITAMNAKDYPTACRMFAASMQEDPQTGTLLNLAHCHELQGKVASAWAEYSEVVARAQKVSDFGRVQFAQKAAVALQEKLTRFTVNVAAPFEAETVTVDGEPIARAAWGTAVPMDPGGHDLVASGSGHKTTTLHFEVTEGAAGGSVSVPPLSEEAPVVRTTYITQSSEPLLTRRGAGYLVGALGLVSLGVGVVTGVVYLTKRRDNNRECVGDPPETNGTLCDQTALDAARSDLSAGKTLGTVSTIGLGLGVVGLGIGGYLVLTSRPPRTRSAVNVRLVPGLGGGAVVGSF